MPAFRPHSMEDLLCQEGEWRSAAAVLGNIWTAEGLPDHALGRAHTAAIQQRTLTLATVDDDLERQQHLVFSLQHLTGALMHEMSLAGLNPHQLRAEVDRVRAAHRHLMCADTVGELLGEEQPR